MFYTITNSYATSKFMSSPRHVFAYFAFQIFTIIIFNHQTFKLSNQIRSKKGLSFSNCFDKKIVIHKYLKLMNQYRK